MGGEARRKKQRRRQHRAVKMSEEMHQSLAGQLEMFQPDADMPKVISEEVIHRELASAAVKAGIDPAIIFAMNAASSTSWHWKNSR